LYICFYNCKPVVTAADDIGHVAVIIKTFIVVANNANENK